MRKKITATILLLILVLSSCTASNSKNTLNLMDNIQESNLTPIEISKLKEQGLSRNEEITDFALKLFSENFEDKNILISPLSIASALAMVTNGAKGNTLTQMEEALNSDIKGLNDYLMSYAAYLPSDEKYRVSLANSIWLKNDEGLTVNQDFLQTNKDYFDASIYKAPFDESTKDDINYWVKDKTKGMIETLLEEAPSEDAVMYLINALSFDAEWANIYNKTQISEGEFILESGEKQEVEFMSSKEIAYLENEMTTGFMKPYADNKYAFVALLPKKNVTMLELLSSLQSKDLMNLVENKEDKEVYAETPKFSIEYDTLLNESLKSLGMLDAFDGEKSDFSGLGKSLKGNIFISRVIHKTRIDVDEKGTKAGAITAVEADTTSAMPEEPKKVILDRPFFYMIVDTKQYLPLFMGSLMSVN